MLFRQVLAERDLAWTETAVLGDSAEAELSAGECIGLWTIQILRERVVLAPRANSHISSLTELPAALAHASQARAAT